MPLIVSASRDSSPSVTVVNKGQSYLVAPSGDSSYVLMNGYTGNFTISKWDYAPSTPKLIKKDGTIVDAGYSTYIAKDYVASRIFNSPGYQYGYYVTFN
jgi:hypothetical protein